MYYRLNNHEKTSAIKRKPPVFVMKTGGFGPSGETRLHFHFQREMKIIVSPGPYPANKAPPEPCILFSSLNQSMQNPLTTEAVRGFWSEWRDSNSRHPGPKPGALPTGPHPDMKLKKNSRRGQICGQGNSTTVLPNFQRK